LLDASVDACGPADAGYQSATMMPPHPPHTGACTANQASDYASCRGEENTTACQEFQPGMPGASCRACIESQSTDPSWGVLVFTGGAGVYNVEGCIDDALGEVALEKAGGGAGSCGDALFAFYGCEAAACTGCAGAALDMCSVVAASVCNAYDSPVESPTGPCGVLLGDAPPVDVQACFSSDTIADETAREVDWINRFVVYMCGS
jgi:hypothetical protein